MCTKILKHLHAWSHMPSFTWWCTGKSCTPSSGSSPVGCIMGKEFCIHSLLLKIANSYDLTKSWVTLLVNSIVICIHVYGFLQGKGWHNIFMLKYNAYPLPIHVLKYDNVGKIDIYDPIIVSLWSPTS